MQFIHILLLIIPLLILCWLLFQNPFLQAQDAEWYSLFLDPVVQEILSGKTSRKILDIGSGTGKLLQMLNNADDSLELSGIDTNLNMLEKAGKRISHRNVTFSYLQPGDKLKFTDNEFDIVTICSVLFLLNDEVCEYLLQEAVRVVKPGGKIIVLTPSVNKSALSAFCETWTYPVSSASWTFLFWKYVTRQKAMKWRQEGKLKDFTISESLGYQSASVFNNNATKEIISRPINNYIL